MPARYLLYSLSEFPNGPLDNRCTKKLINGIKLLTGLRGGGEEKARDLLFRARIFKGPEFLGPCSFYSEFKVECPILSLYK